MNQARQLLLSKLPDVYIPPRIKSILLLFGGNSGQIDTPSDRKRGLGFWPFSFSTACFRSSLVFLQ